MLTRNVKRIDLTQPLNAEAPTWTGSCGFCLEIICDYDQGLRVHAVTMAAGIGTHMDAPSHFVKGGATIADIPCENFFAPACIIDVTKKAHADYQITEEDVFLFEKQFGNIPEGALVIGFTGWSRYWTKPEAYRNADSKGEMHFPSFSAGAAWLLLQKGIIGLAIDTLSPDCRDPDFPVHKMVLGNGKYIIENVADCGDMPPSGSYVVCLPLRWEASESPIRMIGLINEGEP